MASCAICPVCGEIVLSVGVRVTGFEDPGVDTPAHVLDEGAEEPGIDRGDREGRIKGELRH